MADDIYTPPPPSPSYYSRFKQAVAPPPNSWLSRHGKTLAYGLGIGGAVAVGGVLVYSLYNALVGGGPSNPTACAAAGASYNSYSTDITNLLNEYPQGLPTAVSSEINNVLSPLQATAFAEMGTYCSPAPGEVQKILNEYGGYAFWLLAFPIAVLDALVLRWALRKVWSKKKGPGNPPESPSDTVTSPTFNPTMTSTDIAFANLYAQAITGKITPAQAASAVNALSASFPTAGLAAAWQTSFAVQETLVTAAVAEELAAFAAVSLTAAVVALALAEDVEVILPLILAV